MGATTGSMGGGRERQQRVVDPPTGSKSRLPSGPVFLLCVGDSAATLARLAQSRASDTRCFLAGSVAQALEQLAAQPVHAVVCSLAGHDGRRLFQVMQVCYPLVWRVLVGSTGAMSFECAAASSLASAMVTPEGTAALPWLIASALGISTRAP